MATKQARLRVERALREAEHIYLQRPEEQRQTLREVFAEKVPAGRQVQKSLQAIEDNPCGSCGRCCTNAGPDSGFFTHLERQMLLAQGVDLRQYVVPNWEDQPKQRCLFLSSKGCNIPVDYRSVTCLGYACYDRLGPALSKQGQEDNFVSASSLLRNTHRKLEALPRIPFPKEQLNFGEG